MATARDVAKLAGTSTAVVSYVFNNGPRGVAPATKERVLAAAEQLDYRPNMLARSLRAKKSHSIGLIVPDIVNPFFAEVARAIEQAAGALGSIVLIADTAGSIDQEIRHVRSFVERKVDGIVIVSVGGAMDLSETTRAGIRVVALHPVDQESGASSLTIDYSLAAQMATTHLLDHGYSDIALLNGPDPTGGSADHLRGFTAAITTAQMPVKTRVWSLSVSRHAASMFVQEALSIPNPPRAVYCATDEQAFGVLHAAYTLGLNVPGDLAVIGVDGTANTAVSIPPLTTIQQPTSVIAARAADLLIRSEETYGPVHETFGFDFVIRSSCGRH